MYTVIPLGELLSEEYDENILEQAFKKFSCQREPDLENFLMKKAILYEKSDFGKTYLILDTDELKHQNFVIMAYFTISYKGINISNLSNKQRRKMLGMYPGRDHIDTIGAYLIGQLGRSDSYTSEQLPGYIIFSDCYHAISIAVNAIGGRLLVLECREGMYEKFYQKHGFLKFHDQLSKDNLYTLYQKIDFRDYWNLKK